MICICESQVHVQVLWGLEKMACSVACLSVFSEHTHVFIKDAAHGATPPMALFEALWLSQHEQVAVMEAEMDVVKGSWVMFECCLQVKMRGRSSLPPWPSQPL